MNILVCVKQVPNTKHMTIDPETHRLVRHGITSILNPSDRYVLERALRMKDQYGGTVTVISMGVPQANAELISAWLVGADRCLLLTDPSFGGSDTFATASVLAAAVKYEQQRTGENFDVIFCGKSTIDGETGQVGPELAELLGIANFTNISQLKYNGASFEVEYSVNEMKLLINAHLPILVTYPLAADACLRGSIPERLEKVKTEDIQIPQLSFHELSPWLNIDEIGLKGSATKVVRSFVPPTGRKGIRIDKGSPSEKAEKLVEYLKQDGLLGKKTKAASAKTARTVAEKGNGRICVFVEQTSKGSCKNISLELLTPAIEMGDTAAWKVSAIIVGSDNTKAITELKQYPVDEILSCEDARFENMQLHDYVETVAAMVETYQPEGLLVGGTDIGKELASRIASRFHTGLTAECNGIRYDAERQKIVWSRPAYGGKLMADIICKDKKPQMGTVREGVFEKPAPYSSDPEIIVVSAVDAPLAKKVTVIRKGIAPGFAPKGENEISMVVGMGRGIRNMDGLDLCCDFADAIGADIGASRGATELQLISNQYLIGSNGKTIRPMLYFACGISGSLQHMTGVPDSGCIVAINRDPKAEIFQYADYCVVGDMFSIIPELQELMESL